MFVSPSVSSGLEFLSVNHASIYEDSESNVFKTKQFLVEISNNWPKYL